MLKQVQAGTGIFFAGFVILHLTNTWLAALGPGAYDGMQEILRMVYQFAPVEGLLLSVLLVHAVSGVVRIVREPKRLLSTHAKLHRYTGFFLLFVIGGHVLAVRGPSWFFGIYPGFEGLAFSIDYLPAVFYPYYFLLGVAGFYHAANGACLALTRFGWRVHPGPYVRYATGVSSVMMVLALLGLGGVLFDVGDPAQGSFAQFALGVISEFTP